MSNVPDGAQLSEDGYYWWDGENWQPIENADEAGAGDTEGSDSDAGNANTEVTADDLAPANDTGVEAGDQNAIDEAYHRYFEPDYDGIDDDTSESELDEALDDSQATGPAEQNETEGEEN